MKKKKAVCQGALNVAAEHGYIDCIYNVLLEAGADVNKRNSSPEFPLNHAAFGGQTETLQFLLEKGADVNNFSYCTPLSAAAHKGNVDCRCIAESRSRCDH